MRLPTLAELDELDELAAECIHDPSVQPFAVAWTDVPPQERARSVLQFQLSQWGAWSPADWSLNLVADPGGVIVGTQGVSGRDFAVLREVRTGSWLGQRYQGQGLGTEMRSAVLHLGFAGLGAEFAVSDAFTDNPASLGVSRKLGYLPDGILRQAIRGRPAVIQMLRLDRATWLAHRQVPRGNHRPGALPAQLRPPPGLTPLTRQSHQPPQTPAPVPDQPIGVAGATPIG